MRLSKDFVDNLKLAAIGPIAVIFVVSPPIAIMHVYQDVVGETAAIKLCGGSKCSVGVGPVWLSSRRECACLVAPEVSR